jgi:transcriptional regulator with XRE-family HTH domain
LERSSGHRRRHRGTPHPIDIQVGSRVRQRRAQLGLGQTQLAEAVGTTYQQLQKYERGTNRIRASRLLEIALVLGVPISFFTATLILRRRCQRRATSCTNPIRCFNPRP